MSWSAAILALQVGDGDALVSRLPSFLHPVAGRPLIWHTLQTLLELQVPPAEVLVVGPPELSLEMFEDIPLDLRLISADAVRADRMPSLEIPTRRLVVLHASAHISPEIVHQLADGEDPTWVDDSGVAAGIAIDPKELPELLRMQAPFSPSHRFLPPDGRVRDATGAFVVRSRSDLARAHREIRDRIVKLLMDGGATFMLPESVLVDVDSRIGRDTVIYPGVVIEGQTTIGEESVIGPGCRIIDSWIGSGVELKGWNYISNTSVRNRAILEPYVRRGFD